MMVTYISSQFSHGKLWANMLTCQVAWKVIPTAASEILYTSHPDSEVPLYRIEGSLGNVNESWLDTACTWY